jgi:hypothetical protein
VINTKKERKDMLSALVVLLYGIAMYQPQKGILT